MKNFVLAGFGSLALAASASAAFTGFSADCYFNGAENSVIDLYANYSTEADVLLNIFNANVGISSGFGDLVHNNFGPGPTWAPQLANPADNDSFVIIGGVGADFLNSTTADPNFAPGFGQVGIPANAGWFNSSPPNLQGKASTITFHDGTTKIGTFIGRFVAIGNLIEGRMLTIQGSQTNNQGLGTPGVQGSGSGSFEFKAIPAPGALALLGFAGLVGGRRRRA